MLLLATASLVNPPRPIVLRLCPGQITCGLLGVDHTQLPGAHRAAQALATTEFAKSAELVFSKTLPP